MTTIGHNSTKQLRSIIEREMTIELVIVDAEKLAALLRKAADCLSYAIADYDRRVGMELDAAADELEKKEGV